MDTGGWGGGMDTGGGGGEVHGFNPWSQPEKDTTTNLGLRPTSRSTWRELTKTATTELKSASAQHISATHRDT